MLQTEKKWRDYCTVSACGTYVDIASTESLRIKVLLYWNWKKWRFAFVRRNRKKFTKHAMREDVALCGSFPLLSVCFIWLVPAIFLAILFIFGFSREEKHSHEECINFNSACLQSTILTLTFDFILQYSIDNFKGMFATSIEIICCLSIIVKHVTNYCSFDWQRLISDHTSHLNELE